MGMMLTERGTGNGWAAASVSPDDRPLDGHLLLDLRQPPTRSPRRITTVHGGASQTTRRASRASRRTPHDAPTTSSASRLAPRAGDSGGTRRLAVRRRSRRRPANAGRGTRRRTASRRVSHAQTAASPTVRQPHSPPPSLSPRRQRAPVTRNPNHDRPAGTPITPAETPPAACSGTRPCPRSGRACRTGPGTSGARTSPRPTSHPHRPGSRIPWPPARWPCPGCR